jgi:hypothetical protein
MTPRAPADVPPTPDEMLTFVDDQTNPRRIAILHAIQASQRDMGVVSAIFERALAEHGYAVVSAAALSTTAARYREALEPPDAERLQGMRDSILGSDVADEIERLREALVELTAALDEATDHIDVEAAICSTRLSNARRVAAILAQTTPQET